MDKPTPNEHDESWLDEFLDAPNLADELGPDENAVSAAGLTHPADAELERIIQETKELPQEEELDLQQTRQISGIEELYTATHPEDILDSAPGQEQGSDTYAQYDDEEYADGGIYDDGYADEEYSDEELEEQAEEEPARPRILFRRRI